MWRLRLLQSVIYLAFAVIIIRGFYWQIIRGDELRRDARLQHFTSFDLPSKRGSILSFTGEPFALSTPAYLLYAEPKKIDNKLYTSEVLAKKIDIASTKLYDILNSSDKVWIPLKHKVSQEEHDQILSSQLPGIGFEKESKRYYPEASMAAHLLGFIGSDVNGNDKGYFGLEGFYDRELRGKEGRILQEKDVHGQPIVSGIRERIEPEDGRSLRLFVDKSVQKITEKRLLDGLQRYEASEGSVVIMDPFSGGILASASYPNYNPEAVVEFPKEYFNNPVVSEGYEPGSTFKVLIMSVGISENLVSADTTYDENAPVVVSGYAIRTWNNEYNGVSTMTDVIRRSSNVGMVFVANKIGHDKMIQSIKNFGFGNPSQIDLEDETSPQLRKDNEWREIDVATSSFGQGIAVTPIQMVRAVAAIANGGLLIKPRVVAAFVDSNDSVIPIADNDKKRVISSRAATVIKEMMINAVSQGESKWAAPKNYRIAGKTGTAQIAIGGTYDEKKTIASFVGFAPPDNPKFVMLVTLREPKTSQWGSETAAPLFFAIAKDLFAYWKILPDS